MSDHFGERISRLASDYEEKIRVEEAAKKRKDDDQQDFLSRFRVASERSIVTKLKDAERHSNGAVKFVASGLCLSVRIKGRDCKIVFKPDYHREMVVVTLDERDSASIELSKLTPEWVEEEVEKRISWIIPK